jgi:predicted phosphodiesterase
MMARKITNKHQILRDLLDRFPQSSNVTIAKKAIHDYPVLFDDVELTRTMIRYIIGSNGNTKRKSVQNKVSKVTFSLPISKGKEREFVRIDENNILWISDIHIPNQNNQAIELAIEDGIKEKINCIILGGDVMDNTPFTSHDAPPPSPDDVRNYFEMTQQFLSYLRSKFPKIHIVWIEGNHDNWISRWLMKKAPILFNDPYYHLPQRLDLKKYSIDFHEQEVILQIGKLSASHGHTIVRGVFAPVNAARGVFMRTKSNYIVGHVHTTSAHHETNIKGEQIGCFSVGCLCELSPSYDPHNTKHNLGYAIIKVEKGGDFIVYNKTIINGKVH